MRQKYFIISLLITIIFYSCSEKKKRDAAPALPNGEYCYEYNLSYDTIRVKMNIADGKVDGTMRYIFFEKDNSAGEITGKMEGDKIIAVYNARSSGGTLSSEVIFLLRDGELNIGFGEMEDKNGTMVFRDTSVLNFDTFIMRPMECK